MSRPAVVKAAQESGVAEELLTTHADLFGGLPDIAPYNEVVCMVDSVGRDDPERVRWEAFLWRKFKQSGVNGVCK